jgi:hypothetical protein
MPLAPGLSHSDGELSVACQADERPGECLHVTDGVLDPTIQGKHLKRWTFGGMGTGRRSRSTCVNGSTRIVFSATTCRTWIT